MVSVPFPLSVRSSFEKMTASILLSSIASYSAVFIRIFSEPSASVIKVLSALFTYIAALEAHVMSALSSTSCTFASSASTITCPSVRVPDRIYVPSSVIVMAFPSTVTPLTEVSSSSAPMVSVVESSARLMCTASLSS